MGSKIFSIHLVLIATLTIHESKPTRSTLAIGRGPSYIWLTLWGRRIFPTAKVKQLLQKSRESTSIQDACLKPSTLQENKQHTTKDDSLQELNKIIKAIWPPETNTFFSSRITVLWDTRRTECWLWCGCQGREISNSRIVAWAIRREQENAFTGRAWLVRSSSSLRRVMFAEPAIRDSLKRPWSLTKSQIDLGPKLELTCSVTEVVTTTSVGINTPPFGRSIFLSTHGQQQWFGSWRPNSLGTVFQKRACQTTAHNSFRMNLRSSIVIGVSLTWQAPRHTLRVTGKLRLPASRRAKSVMKKSRKAKTDFLPCTARIEKHA